MTRGQWWTHGQRDNTKKAGGYTVVETLIFLAISAVMFVSVLGLVGGQQSKTEFQTGVRDFESQLLDIANDVSTGTSNFAFSNDPTVSCKINTSTKQVRYDTSNVGPGDQRCIFVGRVIQFQADGDKGAYRVYSMAGQKRSGGIDVADVASAKAVALTSVTGGATPVDLSQLTKFTGGVEIHDLTYGSNIATGAIAFYTTFGSNVASSSIHVNLAVINNSTPLGKTEAAMVGVINDPTNTIQNPNGGIALCLDSTSTNQHANMGIGTGGNGQLTTTTTIDSGHCT